MEHTFYRRLLSAVCAIALAFTAVCPAVAAAPEDTTGTPQTLTVSEVQEMQQTDAAVTALTDSAAYAGMSEEERQAAALAQLDVLAAQGLVEKDSIYVDAENGMVSFAYRCGALGGILLTDTESEADAALPGPELEDAPALLAAENGTVGNAVIYYAFDNGVNSNRYPYYSYMKDYWNGFGLDTHLDMMVTVSDLKRMADYDLAILSAHGAYYTYEYGWLWKKQATAPILLLLEKSDFWNDLPLRHGSAQPPGHQGERLLRRHRRLFPQCLPGRQDERHHRALGDLRVLRPQRPCGHRPFGRAALRRPAAVAGFVNNVYSVYSRSMLWATVNRLIEGETLQQAIDYGLEVYGENDIVWYLNQNTGRRPHRRVLPHHSGDGTARLTAPGTATTVLQSSRPLPPPDHCYFCTFYIILRDG